MRVLMWATTFGADLWSLARHLDTDPTFDLIVAMKEPQRFKTQPIAKLFPIRAPVISNDAARRLDDEGFTPDVTVMDQWPPRRAFSSKGFMLWHGFGWKGPNDRVEFSDLHGRIAMAHGDPTRPNPDFRWSCFGPTDLEHRVRVSGFARENCVLVGATCHDELRVRLDNSTLAKAFPFDLGKKTALIAPTWHYGDMFSHWGGGRSLLGPLLAHISGLGSNAIVRLHDRYRYPADYAAEIAAVAEEHPNVIFEFRDEAPNGLLSLQVADLLITNFSSIANQFYATGRPTIHVYPVGDPNEPLAVGSYGPRGLGATEARSAHVVWKLPPEDNGGLLARTFPQLLELLETAFADPDCGRAPAVSFLERHMLWGMPGTACERVAKALRAMTASDVAL